MLQIHVLRANVQEVKDKLSVKNFSQLHLVDEAISLDDDRKKLQLQFDNNQSLVNATSKEIGALMAKGDKAAAEQKKQLVAELKATLQPISESLTAVENKLHQTLVQLPNLPSSLVPKGVSAEDNEIVKEVGEKPVLYASAIPHWDLIK